MKCLGIATWCPPIYYHQALQPLLQHHFQPPTPPKANSKKKHGNINFKNVTLSCIVIIVVIILSIDCTLCQALKPSYNTYSL